MKLVIIAIAQDGAVTAEINGKPYSFVVDAALLPWINKNKKHRPGKVLNVLKKFNSGKDYLKK
jgi:hypothetical protein